MSESYGFEKVESDLVRDLDGRSFDNDGEDVSDQIMDSVDVYSQRSEDHIRETQSLINEMTVAGGTKKQLATDLEQIHPGIITERVAMESFTADYTRTNLKITMEQAANLHRGLQAGLIAALCFLGYKLIQWIMKVFGKTEKESEEVMEEHTAAINRYRKIDSCISQIATDLANAIQTTPKLDEEIAQVAGWRPEDFIYSPEKTLREVTDGGLKEASEKRFTKLVDAIMVGGEMSRVIHLLCQDIPKRCLALNNAIERFSNEVSQKSFGQPDTYNFDLSIFKELYKALQMVGDVPPNPNDAMIAILNHLETMQKDMMGAAPDFARIEKANFHASVLGSVDIKRLKTIQGIDSRLHKLATAAKAAEKNPGDLVIDGIVRVIRNNLLATHGEFRCVQVLNIAIRSFVISIRVAVESRATILKRICEAVVNSDRVTPQTRAAFKNHADKLR